MKRTSAVKKAREDRVETELSRVVDAEQEATRYLDSLGCTRQPDCQCQLCRLSSEDVVSRVSDQPASPAHQQQAPQAIRLPHRRRSLSSPPELKPQPAVQRSLFPDD